MKKTIIAIAIILGLSLSGFAEGGGLFKRGELPNKQRFGRDVAPIMMPNNHGYYNDVNPENGEEAPLGSGIAVLLGLGAAYLAAKKREEE